MAKKKKPNLPPCCQWEGDTVVVDFKLACEWLELHAIDSITAVYEITKFLKEEYPGTSSYRIVS